MKEDNPEMTEWERDMLGLDRIQKYSYRCRSCQFQYDIEDIVVDAYFFSQACKPGEMPTLTCLHCGGRMEYEGDEKSPREAR